MLGVNKFYNFNRKFTYSLTTPKEPVSVDVKPLNVPIVFIECMLYMDAKSKYKMIASQLSHTCLIECGIRDDLIALINKSAEGLIPDGEYPVGYFQVDTFWSNKIDRIAEEFFKERIADGKIKVYETAMLGDTPTFKTVDGLEVLYRSKNMYENRNARVTIN